MLFKNCENVCTAQQLQNITMVVTQGFVREFVLSKILFYDTTAIPQMWIIFATQNIESNSSILYVRPDIIATNCLCNTSLQNKLQ